MTEISNQAFRLILSPDNGGSVDALQWRGMDLLFPTRHPASGAPARPTERASFPLVPFAGRITGSQFQFDGTPYALTPNFLPEPNAIHGFGWHAAWQVSAQTDTSVTLSHAYAAPQWPATYATTQTFTLTDTACILDMTLTNTGASTMPAGLGWHPYFAADGALISSPVSAIWRPENAQTVPQPEPLSPADNLTSLRPVCDLSVDHCFTRAASDMQAMETRIQWPQRALEVKMTASDVFGHFVVYTPKGEPYFCAEPISHVPDAVNLDKPAREIGLRILRPAETLTGTIRLTPSAL